MTTSKSIDRGYRFPAEITQQAVWLCFRFPLGLRMVEDLLAARGIIVSHESATKPCGARRRFSSDGAQERASGLLANVRGRRPPQTGRRDSA
jgi:putative transposase